MTKTVIATQPPSPEGQKGSCPHLERDFQNIQISNPLTYSKIYSNIFARLKVKG
jgi:hypothetical protein